MEIGKLTTRFVCVLIAMSFSAVVVAAETPVGYVVEIKGTWILNGAKVLSQGDRLFGGDTIRHGSSAREDYITVFDMEAHINASATRYCSSDNCARRIELARTAAPNVALTVVGAVVETVAEIFREPRRRKRLRQSRGTELSESVVKLTDGKVDLSSLINAQGEQYLRWRVVSLDKDVAANWTKPIKLDRPPIISGFQPGLFEINLVRSNGSSFEPVAAAWILVASPADYERMDATFQQVRELTNQWGDKVKSETKLLFLQATLDTLSRKASR